MMSRKVLRGLWMSLKSAKFMTSANHFAMNYVSSGEQGQYLGLDVIEVIVWQYQSLLQRMVKHGDIGQLGEQETQDQLVVSDDTVLTHHHCVHEGVQVDRVSNSILFKLKQQ